MGKNPYKESKIIFTKRKEDNMTKFITMVLALIISVGSASFVSAGETSLPIDKLEVIPIVKEVEEHKSEEIIELPITVVSLEETEEIIEEKNVIVNEDVDLQETSMVYEEAQIGESETTTIFEETILPIEKNWVEEVVEEDEDEEDDTIFSDDDDL